MTVIYLRRLRQSAMNPDRPANALLLNQVQHLREAEKNLPPQYHTHIYANAIRTEGEAAEYIRAVTEAINQAHADVAARRALPLIRRTSGLEIAAATEVRKRPAKRKRKTTKRKR